MSLIAKVDTWLNGLVKDDLEMRSGMDWETSESYLDG
jgi:hypothetical protein